MNKINELTDLQSLIVCIFPFIKNEKIKNMDETTETNFINYLTGFINGYEKLTGFNGCGFDVENNDIIVSVNGNDNIISLDDIINEYFINGWNE